MRKKRHTNPMIISRAVLILLFAALLLLCCTTRDKTEHIPPLDETELSTTGDTETETESSASDDTEEPLTESASPADCFYHEALSEHTKARITGISYPSEATASQISYDELSCVHVLHYNFDGEVQEGELICNRLIAQDLVEIFEELYRHEYPIEKIRLIDEYGADDDASMADNNTSCFNYRVIAGTDRLSNHAYGMAVDINPLYNPYVYRRGGKQKVSPESGSRFADRSASFAHKIDENDLCYQLFIQHGFSWGGSWKNSKDYQHFEKHRM